MIWSGACVKTWILIHTVIDLNSVEPDYYALLPESSKGLQVVAKDMDLRHQVKKKKQYTDARACRCTIQRQSIGHLRHAGRDVVSSECP